MSSKSVLEIDVSSECSRICDFIREMVFKKFKHKGAVVGLSGGIDSAVVGELCVRALGKERVLGLFLPERESNPKSLQFAQRQAEKMGVEAIEVDITGYLEALQVYEKRNAVIKSIFPEFDPSWRFNISLPQDLLDRDRLNYRLITIEEPSGSKRQKRVNLFDWLAISACQNMKQRTRMMQMYHYAEKSNYVVAGTTNRTELLQGFFVKFGDGGVDIEPIAHLYKTQVYEVARHLGVIPEIIDRDPSPDTYSLAVTDREFYFCLDYKVLDVLLHAFERKMPLEQTSEFTGLSPVQVQRAFRDFESKERATWHLRQMPPSLFEG